MVFNKKIQPVDGSLMIDSTLHAVCDGHGRPILLTEGQVRDYKGAAILQHFPPIRAPFWRTEGMSGMVAGISESQGHDGLHSSSEKQK